MREVASLLGHASVDTTIIYTNQDALDLIRAYLTSGGLVNDIHFIRLTNDIQRIFIPWC